MLTFMLTDKEEHYRRELAEAAEHINDYLQEIPLYRPAHDWLIRNGFQDTSYQNDIFKDLDSGRKNMHQVKKELENMDKQPDDEKRIFSFNNQELIMNSKRTIIICPFSKANSFDTTKYCLISISWFPPENWQGKSYGSLMMVSKKQEALALEIPSDDIRGLSLEQLRTKQLNDITMWRYLKHDDSGMNKIFEDIFKLAEDKIPVLMWRESETSKESAAWYYLTTWDLNKWLENHPELNYEVVWADTDDRIEKVFNDIAFDSEKRIVIAVLKEFNEWRRGHGEYAWNEDPSKNKDLEITPKQIGEAIDFAVEFLKTH